MHFIDKKVDSQMYHINCTKDPMAVQGFEPRSLVTDAHLSVFRAVLIKHVVTTILEMTGIYTAPTSKNLKTLIDFYKSN